MDPQSIRHLHALRSFIRNLVEQAERSEGCECHRPPSLLLVGPPGAGKTFLVKQMSNVCEMPLFGVHTHQLNGPNSLRNLFNQARELDYPSLFFLDDLDHIFSDHDQTPSHSILAESLRQELYAQLGCRKLKIFDPHSKQNPVRDPLTSPCSSRRPSCTTGSPNSPDNNGLILVAATSSPWLLYKDHELLSRFRGVYLVGLPDKETRFHLIKSLLQKVQHNLTDKDILLVAEKTEGYTPSDLMVVIKNLNYKQFAFLLSMAGVTGFHESSDNESLSSSDMTESDTETESNDDATRDSIDQLSDGKSSGNSTTPVASSISSGKNSTNSTDGDNLKTPAGTLAKVEADWVSDEDEEKRPRKQTTFSSTPKKESFTRMAMATPASGLVTSERMTNNENNDEDEEMKLIDEALKDLDKVCGFETESRTDSCSPPRCDNNLNNTTTEDATVDHHAVFHSTENHPSDDHLYPDKITNDLSGERAKENNLGDSVDKSPKLSNLLTEPVDGEENDVKSFEFHLFQPPDPMRNDNQTVDSGSESDKEDGVMFPRRTRRVNFSDAMPLAPLMVDIGSRSPTNLIDYVQSDTITTTLEEKLLSQSPYRNCDDSSNNILKRLLSSSPPRHGEEELKGTKTEPAKDDLLLEPKEIHHTVDLIGMYGEVERSESPPSRGIDQIDFARSILGGGKSSDRARLRRSLSPGGSDDRVIDGRRSMSLGGTPQLTPTGSDISCHEPTDNASDNGRQSRDGVINSRDGEINKIRDSDSPATPSSVVSTGTCNMSGETLECHSDSEERFRNLDEDLKNDREKGNLSEEEMSNEGNEAESLQAFFNLNNLGEVSIKIITIEDVLSVVSRTKRSVSDEEIKKYTDFMMWFADVAKSACPHNSKGSTIDSSSIMSETLTTSSWDDSTGRIKKRKGPLHKLGRFLLKALMLLLD